MPKTIHQSQLTVHYDAARLYHSTASVWLSVDPLSDKYPSVSPYVYCTNNPVRLVDPDGREIGDYYDLNGNYLGWDGIDDGKVYVVTDKNAISYSSALQNRKHYFIYTIKVNDNNEVHRIPSSSDQRSEIITQLENFDECPPNAEWGGLCGDVLDKSSPDYGTEQTVWGSQGEDGNPCIYNATKSYSQMRNSESGYNGYGIFFDYHSHGSGKCADATLWTQEPGEADRENVSQRQQHTYHRFFAVFSLGDKDVHFYNGTKNCGSISFNTFINIGR